MSSDTTIWYRVGYALERARRRGSPSDGEPMSRGPRGSPRGDAGAVHWPSADDLIASGVAALAGKVLDAWRPARKVTLTRLLRAGAAGAGAALLVQLVKPLLSGRAELPTFDDDVAGKLLAGVVEPRVPGPPLVKGAVFAVAEYLADPAGGLSHLLGSHAPHARLPLVSAYLTDLEPHDREYLEHLAFGVALAVLCGSGPAVNGGAEDDADD
jgi:hypothetical protein